MKSRTAPFARLAGLFQQPARAVRQQRAAGRALASDGAVPPAVARRILIGLMFPSLLMPLASSMSMVALPTMRDEFMIQADMTAWIATAFTLPFMVLMPVYGRLSDGVGKRRLILAGIIIFCIGTAMTLAATDMAWLMIGRAIQGIGTAGMVPLGMAFISAIFRPEERGEALGAWSAVGPMIGFVSPFIAGFLVDEWGWRSAFVPPLLVGMLTIVAIYLLVPSGLSKVISRFWRSFDWTGVVLLSSALTSLLFYLSSRPITGVAPLQDWRLLTVTVVLFTVFLWWERRCQNPFVDLNLFRLGSFNRASFSASMRMVIMSGSGFLLPLYLVDVYGLSARGIGFMAMVNPGAMMLVVRYAGRMADRWGSDLPIVIGSLGQGAVMLALAFLPGDAPIWSVALLMAIYGLGAGLMLAPLHYAAMAEVREEEMGSAAGMYSMVRFAGSTIGTALIGVLLQYFFDQSLPVVESYQYVYLCLAAISVIGLVGGLGLRKKKVIG
jgi:EmrB/QacA subfamily drug resistance transporter